MLLRYRFGIFYCIVEAPLNERCTNYFAIIFAQASNDAISSKEPSPQKPKIKWPSRGSSSTDATVPKTTSLTSLGSSHKFNVNAYVEDISAFLPPGFKLPGREESSSSTEATAIVTTSSERQPSSTTWKADGEEETPVKSLISDIFAKSKVVDVSSFLPPDYNKKKVEQQHEIIKSADDGSKNKSTIAAATAERGKEANSTKLPPVEKSLQELLSKSTFDISALLPPGYKKPESAPKPTGIYIYKFRC